MAKNIEVAHFETVPAVSGGSSTPNSVQIDWGNAAIVAGIITLASTVVSSLVGTPLNTWIQQAVTSSTDLKKTAITSETTIKQAQIAAESAARVRQPSELDILRFALEDGNAQKRVERLKLLIDAGIIHDTTGTLAKYTEKNIPQLPAIGGEKPVANAAGKRRDSEP